MTVHNVRRTTEKKQTLNDIHDSILTILSDDPHLRKIAIKPLNELLYRLTDKPIETPAETKDEATEFYESIKEDNALPSILDDLENNLVSKQSQSKDKAISDNAQEILQVIQKNANRKLKSVDLKIIAQYFSAKHSIPILKKLKKSKMRLLEWMSHNWGTFEPSLNDAIQHCRETNKWDK
ncbi:hypothetical protein TVAG_192940 [Trichomonas vaginalis G3]|uniref:Uncharacterized protein n=1 Tax=Trichomonas vaginalis (strain ATCC PRA-98 / G3) TaxID=412133 RepID=A2DH08_TRIV3|nr:hypothetical protein TVAGG3_0341720 [Trichomonas vaginalis G3]EAY20318.1 hypothetical protein TVAG_192940 [Trichomonas vaginalis G3]KAI5530693.1 hypothetical protein TVAGG3_0341720 [Trichomonas vaginalis G3]|eukprot:XP_001581304.1 hypothetical protein [Trichomonas vaginalis G3]